MVFCIQNSDFSCRIASLYASQPSSVVMCIHNCDIMTRINSLYGSQPSSVVLCIHNCNIMTRINSLYGSQTSPVVLCMQTNVISIRITSLYWSQPSSAVFACKTAPLASELLVSTGPSIHMPLEGWADFAEDLRVLTDNAYPDLEDKTREQLALTQYLGQLSSPQSRSVSNNRDRKSSRMLFARP